MSIYLLFSITFIYVCVFVGMPIPQCICGGWGFPPSMMWVLVTKLGHLHLINECLCLFNHLTSPTCLLCWSFCQIFCTMRGNSYFRDGEIFHFIKYLPHSRRVWDHSQVSMHTYVHPMNTRIAYTHTSPYLLIPSCLSLLDTYSLGYMSHLVPARYLLYAASYE